MSHGLFTRDYKVMTRERARSLFKPVTPILTLALERVDGEYLAAYGVSDEEYPNSYTYTPIEDEYYRQQMWLGFIIYRHLRSHTNGLRKKGLTYHNCPCGVCGGKGDDYPHTNYWEDLEEREDDLPF